MLRNDITTSLRIVNCIGYIVAISVCLDATLLRSTGFTIVLYVAQYPSTPWRGSGCAHYVLVPPSRFYIPIPTSPTHCIQSHN
jgi:hypothetical protein